MEYKPNWKYKKAYELLAEFIFECDTIDRQDKTELSEVLDEIFGKFRKC